MLTELVKLPSIFIFSPPLKLSNKNENTFKKR